MEPAPPSQKVVYFALLLHVAISSATYLAAKRATMEIPALTLTAVRLALSGILLSAVLLATPGRKVPPRALWPKLIFLGLLCGPVNQGFFLAGLAASRPAHAALLYALTPVGIYLYMMSQKQEQLSTRRLAGIAVAFTGVLVLLLGRGLADATGPLSGDLLILVAVFAWVVYSAEGRRLVAEFGPIRLTAWTMIAGSACALPMLPLLGDVSAVLRASVVALLCLGFIVVFTSVISYLLWYYALSRMTASKAAVFSNLQPVATAILAWAVLGDAINWEIAAGGLLVLAGVRVTQSG